MLDKSFGGWIGAGMEAWALGLEGTTVIGLRIAKIVSGRDPTGEEARLMVSEKLASMWELPIAVFGMPPLEGTREALRYYRGKVSANRQRLSAGR